MLCTRLKHKPKVKINLQHGTPKQGRLMRRSRTRTTMMSSPFKRLHLSPIAERLQDQDNEAFAEDRWNERQRAWRMNEKKRRKRCLQKDDKENFIAGSQKSSGKESGFHDVPSGSDTRRKSGYKTRGQLKVAISIHKELMTVHVVQARLLHSDKQTLCNAYVQMNLSPDDTGKTCCRSEIVYDTNNPQFNEKFTYELMGDDSRKRLTILLWNKDCRNNCTELLGCMSFGMRHLISKASASLVVDGWYHLLGEKLGLSKHLQIPCASSRQQGYLDVDRQVMRVNASLQGMDAHTLVITRCRMGYGFTVTGSCPVKVGSVRAWSAAHEGGLQEGDFIVRINGLNVSRSSVESVATIVRLSEKQITVDIHRIRPSVGVRDKLTSKSGQVRCWLRQDIVTSTDQSLSAVISQTKCSLSQTQAVTKTSLHSVLPPALSSITSPCSNPNMAVLDDAENLSCDHKPTGKRNLNQLVKTDVTSRVDLTRRLPCQQEHSDDNLLYSSRELLRWDPFMSPIHGSDSFRIPFIESVTMESSFDESMPDTSLPCKPNCTMVTEEQKIVTSYSYHSAHIDRLLVNSMSVGSVMAEQSWLPRQPNCTLASIITDTESDRSEAEDWEGSRQGKDVAWEKGRMSVDEGKNGSLRCSTPEPRNSRSNFSDESEADLERKLAIHDVVNCEDGFITQMQCGIQRFSRPLRHCIISSKQHATLFQNVEKLVVISQYHLSQILELTDHIEISHLEESIISTTQDVLTDNVAAVYITNMTMLCVAYDSYQQGLEQALQLLRQLTKMPDFARFLQVSSPETGQLDIEEFLKKPIKHLKELLSHLERVQQYTPQIHNDYKNMNEVIQALQGTVSTGMPSLTNVTSAVSRSCHQSHVSLLAPSCQSTNVRSKSLLSLGSLDSDVMELQNNVTFSHGIKHFQVAAPNRHLIFSGNLLWVHNATCWPVWVLLLSDMLLLTRRGTGSHLVVIEEPLNLCNIVKIQFELDHPSEFAICCTAENTSQTESKTYILRAPDMERKCTWKTILEHRRHASHQPREQPLQLMSDNIFI